MLEVGFANDARQAVGRAELVRGLKPVQAQDAATTAREVISTGAAHGSQAHNNDIVIVALHAAPIGSWIATAGCPVRRAPRGSCGALRTARPTFASCNGFMTSAKYSSQCRGDRGRKDLHHVAFQPQGDLRQFVVLCRSAIDDDV